MTRHGERGSPRYQLTDETNGSTTIAPMAEPAEQGAHRASPPRSQSPGPRSVPATPGAGDGPPLRSVREHVGVLRRRWLVILVSSLAAVLVALAVSLTQPTRYQATTDVLVPLQVPSGGGDVGQQLLAQRSFDPNRAMQDEARIATAASNIDEVRQQVGGPISLVARSVKDADVLQITATADTAERARDAANAAAELYLRRHNDGVARQSPSTSPAIVLQPASLPTSPSQPTVLRNLVLALAAGVLVGVALAYFVDALDDE